VFSGEVRVINIALGCAVREIWTKSVEIRCCFSLMGKRYVVMVVATLHELFGADCAMINA